jgi:TP901 family phage tail tape measure protein
MELSKVIVTLFADTKEYMAKMDMADEKMAKFGLTAEASSSKMTAFANKASSAMIGFGVGAIAYGVDAAYKFQDALDKVKDQSNLTDAQLEKLRGHIIDTSNQTGISADALANASLIMSQAGITGTKSFQLMNAAAKAAVITNTDVASVTQTLISAQNLQVAKGMSVVDLTGKLVAGSKSFVGGLQAEEAMLKGRVGVALANYGLKLSQIIPIGAEFTKVALPARSVTSFAQALGDIQNPTKAYAKGLANVGLSAAQLGQDVRSGNVIQLLKDVNEAAIKGGGPLSQYTNAVFGKTGGAGASVLIKNLQDLVKVQNQVSGGGANSLGASFAEASKQLGPQLKIFDANLTNALISVGQVVLPKLSGLLSGLNSFFKNKGAVEALGITLAAAFVGAVGLKLFNIFKGAISLFNSAKQLIATSANTVALEENTAALLGKGGGGLTNDAKNIVKKGGWLAGLTNIATGLFSKTGPAAIVGLGVYDVYKTVTDPGKFLNPNNGWLPFLNPSNGTATPNAPKSTESVPLTDSQGNATNTFVAITQAQINALNKWWNSAATQNLSVGQQNSYADNIMRNWANQDQKGNYSVTIRVM